jgi:transcription elongation factor Elf1
MTATKTPRPHQHTGTHYIVCPSCGHTQEEAPDLSEGSNGVARCEICREWYGWQAAITVKYTTTRKVPKGPSRSEVAQ